MMMRSTNAAQVLAGAPPVKLLTHLCNHTCALRPFRRGLAPYSLERTSAGSQGVCTYRQGQGPEKQLECGCTCTAAIVQGRTVCLANVGDSSAVLGSRSAEGSAQPYAHRVLSVQHNVHNPDEAERITREHPNDVRLLKVADCLLRHRGRECSVAT